MRQTSKAKFNNDQYLRKQLPSLTSFLYTEISQNKIASLMNPMQLLMGNNKNNIESEREDKKKNLITEVSILRWQRSHFEHSAKV